MQSQTERDMAGLQARREREAAPQEFADEEDSKAYSPPERRNLRSKRPTDKRVERLEEKHDRLDEKVDGIDSRTARMEGKLDTALSLVTVAHTTERHRIDSRTKVIIAIVGAAGTAIGIVITALSGCA